MKKNLTSALTLANIQKVVEITMSKQLEPVKNDINSLKTDVSGLKINLSSLNEKIDQMDKKFEKRFDEAMTDMDKLLGMGQAHEQEHAALSMRVERLEQNKYTSFAS